jgi:hypothetical protein
MNEAQPINHETVKRIYKDIEVSAKNSGSEFQQFEDISRLMNLLEGSEWNIQGHFGVAYRFTHPSTNINRSVLLVNDNINSPISEIDVCGYSDGDYMFMIRARNESAHNQIVCAMGPREFYEKSLTQHSVILATGDLSLISHMIKRLLAFDPTLKISLEHVMSIIKNDLEKAYADDNIPIWLRRCDIKFWLPDSGSQISRNGIYHNTRPSDLIRKVEVIVYKGEDFFRIGIEARNREGLMKLIERFGMHEFYEVSKNSDEIYVKGNSAPKFATFFSKLLEIQPDFRPCFNEIQAGIKLDLSKSLSQEELERFPPSRVSPDYNETHADLTRLQIDALRRVSEGSAQRSPTLSFSNARAKQHSFGMQQASVDQELGETKPKKKMNILD